MTRVSHCAYPIAYDSILHAELGPHRSVDQQPVDACGCDFHRDRAVDGNRVSLHFRPKSDRPGQGSIKSTAAGRPPFSGSASCGDARLCENSSRHGQLPSSGLHSFPDRDSAHHFPDRSVGSIFGMGAAKPAQSFPGGGASRRSGDRRTRSSSNCLRNCRARLRPSMSHWKRKSSGVSWPRRKGQYDIHIAAAGQTVSKQVVVSPGLARISPVRLRDNFWERHVHFGEPPLADNSPVQSIAITYPPRVITFAWMEWNWIVLFFVVSLIAGFVFKSCPGNSGMKLLSCPQKRLGAWFVFAVLIIGLVLAVSRAR